MTEQILYTIGHSNQTAEQFLDLLRQYQIEVLVDVRSAPYSRYVPHFNKQDIEKSVKIAGLKYIYLGRELGGRPERNEHYDAEGHALYSEMAKTSSFVDGIRRLNEGIARYRVAIMCSEENPNDCHRRLLVSRVLIDDGIDIFHIRGDGSIDNEREMREAEKNQQSQSKLPGFDEEEPPTWRSTQSVLPANQPRNSSDS